MAGLQNLAPLVLTALGAAEATASLLAQRRSKDAATSGAGALPEKN